MQHPCEFELQLVVQFGDTNWAKPVDFDVTTTSDVLSYRVGGNSSLNHFVKFKKVL